MSVSIVICTVFPNSKEPWYNINYLTVKELSSLLTKQKISIKIRSYNLLIYLPSLPQ